MVSKIKICIFGLFCFLVYLVFCLPAIHQPLLGDSVILSAYAPGFYHPERLDRYFAQDLFFSPGVWHPPLYINILSLVSNFMLLNQTIVRFIGIICFSITLLLIFRLAMLVFEYSPQKKKMALLAVLLYSLNPMAIQGSLLPDIDTSIMVPLLLGFICLFLGLKERKGKEIILGVYFGVLLWAKLTTPFLLVFSVAVFYWRKGRIKEGLIKSGWISLTGISLFLVSWFAFSYFFKKPFVHPFIYLKNTLFHQTLFSYDIKSFSILRTAARLILYLTPFYCVVYALSLSPGFKKSGAGDKKLFLQILGLSILVSYFFIGGLTHSFPKYQYPFIAISTVLVAGLLIERIKLENKHIGIYFWAVIGILFCNILAAGDLLYLSDYRLRESIILNGGISPNLAVELTKRLIVYSVPFVLFSVWFLMRKKKVILWNTVFLWLIASFLSQDLIQAKADYSTVYCYGAGKTTEVLELLNRITGENKFILTSADMYYNINKRNKQYAAYFQTSDYLKVDNFIAAVKRQTPSAVVFGISTNTIDQYRGIFENPKVISFFNQQGYRKSVLGSYTIWTKG